MLIRQDINQGFLNGIWIKKGCYEILTILISPIYSIWTQIVLRCHNQKNQ